MSRSGAPRVMSAITASRYRRYAREAAADIHSGHLTRYAAMARIRCDHCAVCNIPARPGLPYVPVRRGHKFYCLACALSKNVVSKLDVLRAGLELPVAAPPRPPRITKHPK